MVTVSPYKIDVPQEVIDDLWERLHRTRWPDEIAGTGWSRGCDLSYMKELVKYWIDEYDWRNQETALNQHNHYQGNVDGLNIHFLHEKGKGPNPMPLFMMHGYPWSFTMLLRILPMLTDPEAHGGDPEDAFTVIVPFHNWFWILGISDGDRLWFSASPAKVRQIDDRRVRLPTLWY